MHKSPTVLTWNDCNAFQDTFLVWLMINVGFFVLIFRYCFSPSRPVLRCTTVLDCTGLSYVRKRLFSRPTSLSKNVHLFV